MHSHIFVGYHLLSLSQAFNRKDFVCLNFLLVCLRKYNPSQVLGSESNECVFSRGTPTHSRQTLSLPLSSPVPASCAVVIYEAEELMEEPPEEAVLAQVLSSFMVQVK